MDRFQLEEAQVSIGAERGRTTSETHHVQSRYRIGALGRQFLGAAVVLERLPRVELGVALCSGVLHPTGIQGDARGPLRWLSHAKNLSLFPLSGGAVVEDRVITPLKYGVTRGHALQGCLRGAANRVVDANPRREALFHP